MEITKDTKNTIQKWCADNGVSINTNDLNNYKRFLALDGLDKVAYDDRLSVAVMNSIADTGEAAYISGTLHEKKLINLRQQLEISYTEVFDDSGKAFITALRDNSLQYCKVFDRQRGKIYVCYLPSEVETYVYKLKEQEQKEAAAYSAISEELEKAKEQEKALQVKIEGLERDLYIKRIEEERLRKTLKALR